MELRTLLALSSAAIFLVAPIGGCGKKAPPKPSLESQIIRKAPPPPKPEPVEAPPTTSAVMDGLTIRVVSANIGAVAVKTPSGKVAITKDMLAIGLEITNASETQVATYSTVRDTADMDDNLGNKYSGLRLGQNIAPGAITRSRVYPGKSVSDMLWFEKPVEKAEYFDIQLNVGKAGDSGVVRLRIPASTITRP